jgi:hypothetical protein
MHVAAQEQKSPSSTPLGHPVVAQSQWRLMHSFSASQPTTTFGEHFEVHVAHGPITGIGLSRLSAGDA